MFTLFDGRAKGGNPDDALVLDTAATEAEAREEGSTTWKNHDAVWYGPDGKERGDIPPGNYR